MIVGYTFTKFDDYSVKQDILNSFSRMQLGKQISLHFPIYLSQKYSIFSILKYFFYIYKCEKQLFSLTFLLKSNDFINIL